MERKPKETRTEGGSVTEALPGGLGILMVRRRLDAIRAWHGADTPTGHRCSNLIEMLKNYETAPPDLRQDLKKFIADSVADLARLSEALTKQ